MNYYDNFEIHEIYTSRIQSGWLDNKGIFHTCRWGKHTELAYDLIEQYGWQSNFWEDEAKNCMENARDWLVRVKGWVLLDNPYHDNHTQKIVYNPLKKRTKAQINKLLKLFEGSPLVIEYIMEEL